MTPQATKNIEHPGIIDFRKPFVKLFFFVFAFWWFFDNPFSLIRETTGYAGGGTPQKSFSFKYRAKRATSKGTYKLVQRGDRRDSARLRAAEQLMQSKEYSVRL